MKGNIFSPEDKEFLEIVHSDLKNFLRRNIFPSRTVLVFPPFNGFRRFLIHKLIEDNFAASQVVAFSIGQDISRRIVICYKGLLREDPNKSVTSNLPVKTGFTMIEKEKANKQKLTPTAAVYRPPAARVASPRPSTEDIAKSNDKRTRVRRPDQQVYVPRPKRASFGNEQPRSRSRSSSRTSLESDIQDISSKCTPLVKGNTLRHSVSVDAVNKTSPSEQHKHQSVKNKSSISPEKSKEDNSCKTFAITESVNAELRLDNVVPSKDPTVLSLSHGNEGNNTVSAFSSKSSCVSKEPKHSIDNSIEVVNSEVINSYPVNESSTVDKEPNLIEDAVIKNQCNASEEKNFERLKSTCMNIQEESLTNSESKIEMMDTISISSDSQGDQSSSVSTGSSCESTKNSLSSESDILRNPNKEKSDVKMEIDHAIDDKKKEEFNEERTSSYEQNLKNRRIFPNLPVSDVLIISDSSSSSDSPNPPKKRDVDSNKEKATTKKESKASIKKKEKPSNVNKVIIDPSDCDWESLYDDSGECLVPDLMEELTNTVGKVRVTSADSDYRPFQTIEERSNDGECVIEIYDFPAEFKTTDLFNIFASYRSKNFQIKWVDDTHALGIFPTPLMADEVLACTLPFVKTRPLRLGIAESRNKARNLVLPPLPSMERPKTCTALARRLVTGALGLRIPTSSQEREKEKQVLKEARERRRLEAKQREAAWDGTLTSNSCI